MNQPCFELSMACRMRGLPETVMARIGDRFHDTYGTQWEIVQMAAIEDPQSRRESWWVDCRVIGEAMPHTTALWGPHMTGDGLARWTEHGVAYAMITRGRVAGE